MNSESRFFWIDLEMTGLDASRDVILEIASIVTDTQLNIIAQGPHCVIHQPAHHLDAMIHVVTELHTASGLINLVRESNTTLEQAAQETYAFMTQYCQRHKTYLAGNSVWMDRTFLARYMPKLTSYMHYRLIDVSSIKLLSDAWYPEKFAEITPNKKGGHRALDDVKESIEELRRYKEHFFV